MIKTHEKVTGLNFWQVAKEYKEDYEYDKPVFFFSYNDTFQPIKSLEVLVKQHKANNIFRNQQWLVDLIPNIEWVFKNKDAEVAFKPTSGYNLIAFCKVVAKMSEAAE